MATTCGYICPQCNGTGLTPDSLDNCSWCDRVEITTEKWIETVHEQSCCSDIGQKEEKNLITNSK
jgi:hypothetical protein